MFCSQCGEDNRDDREFCVRCGNPLKEGIEKTPKQIKKEEKAKYDYVRCETMTYQVINMILWPLIIISAILTFISFYLDEDAKFIVIIIAFILLLGCFGLVISKRVLRKNTKEQKRQEDKVNETITKQEEQTFEQLKIEDIEEKDIDPIEQENKDSTIQEE